ncbi:hypothetical protein B0A48_10790 [Cryoendolithus antarcticus]|uniref:Bromodomain associated domain-containing protein n=1 Tax=Cryoendolithus antarcticus TaxID=1507870 RepID=A0A1V8SYP2_9PEZI|nr:hypothetical protein B0A48_10790 [Cryoendolithus antarcticus]
MSQSHDLHHSLLRPFIIHTLRAAGFHTTKPSVLETLTNLAERHLLLLASTTLLHAQNGHNTSEPTISDVRMAMRDAGVLVPFDEAGEEEWQERSRRPMKEVQGEGSAGEARARAEAKRREERDLRDVREFVGWFEGPVYAEIQRIAGLAPEPGNTAVGVGGGRVVADDFVVSLKRKIGKVGDDGRFAGTVLGRMGEEKAVVIEGGPVQSLREWRPPVREGMRASEVKKTRVEDTIELPTEEPVDMSIESISDKTLDNDATAMDTKTSV